ncbi:UAA transporter family-domain-containing protein [Parachaetomium inaequale]|uniref:UDP-galactose transporter homolog 1 n=1 Tax=Parachaetomium inaequale TaxID=2588326 RepID=A0AAN6SUX8_9PEZI|nr:UAA transporter family-domain-containing protein [Parachaetomium inaequale]
MARIKQATPLRREPSSEYSGKHDRTPRSREVSATHAMAEKPNGTANGHASAGAETKAPVAVAKKEAGIVTLIIDVAGIYASFLTWAYLQEKLTTTTYGPASAPERFKFPVFLLTIQSLFASLGGKLFSMATTPRGQPVPPLIPSRDILPPLLLVAFTNALAAPFGYAALAHIDYITYILAKSCKLLPVMFLHITVFRKRYPLYKYLVVAAVTCGVAVFTLHSGSRKHTKAATHTGQTAWGMLLLGINLLFDGLTNSTQDYIFQNWRGYTGPQMMAANNLLGSVITGGYLVLSPWLVGTAVGEWFGMDVTGGGGAGELQAALGFLGRYPEVWKDVLGFAVCGCVGQVFIFHTLSTFSSVLLVTVTVTRKMFTMILSVVAFGHRLSQMQWLGVGLVFGGIGVEAQIARREKLAKEAAKRKEKGQ